MKKIIRYSFVVLFLLFTVLYTAFWFMFQPKSDESIKEAFKDSFNKPHLSQNSFRGFSYRKLTMSPQIDTSKTTLVFVHGTPGSILDFKAYLQDSLLNVKFNMMSYDRVGYNFNEQNEVQKSIAFEVDLLEDMIKELPNEKIILVGYSYGGPIVLASKNKYQSIITLAPAVYSAFEKYPFPLKFYSWKLTRWLVPNIWKSAAKEKLSHKEMLSDFEKDWQSNPNKIRTIHGDQDGIVPYDNSLFLQQNFPSSQLQLLTIHNAGHGLIWSNFNQIKSELLKQQH